MPLNPTREQLRALAAGPDGPVVMLNLLKYVDRVGEDGPTGERMYARYGARVQPLLEKIGAVVLWQGAGAGVFIGDDDADAWDGVVLVRYPSRRAFLEMVGSPEYQEVTQDRDAALADSRLVVTTEVFGRFS